MGDNNESSFLLYPNNLANEDNVRFIGHYLPEPQFQLLPAVDDKFNLVGVYKIEANSMEFDVLPPGEVWTELQDHINNVLITNVQKNFLSLDRYGTLENLKQEALQHYHQHRQGFTGAGVGSFFN